MNSVLTQSSRLHTTAAHLARRNFEPDDRSKGHPTSLQYPPTPNHPSTSTIPKFENVLLSATPKRQKFQI
ncbi:hypothetical protein GALMADRAFT_254301 [Galerina marginata CBS 339.88]|uniref:Uncharacterized protein n=1 Tax=Galerina marginata (strain CBS 339.88) TaxID=685588 RepID=A0A067SM39_GALM3|nr:hypothetical protein GALMADRAFT_254301 [Galerina marginata CBS 339.88]